MKHRVPAEEAGLRSVWLAIAVLAGLLVGGAAAAVFWASGASLTETVTASCAAFVGFLGLWFAAARYLGQ